MIELNVSTDKDKDAERTIEDFGDQWTHYIANDGYYGSPNLFADIIEPLLTSKELIGKSAADIGSGTGRIVRMLLNAGASKVLAIEPSRAIDVLRANIAEFGGRVECINAPGQNIPATADLDYVFSIGVLHHIPDPNPVVAAAFAALKPGGKMLIWLYGKEGNGLYLALVKPFRAFTKIVPHTLLTITVWALYLPLLFYINACAILPLPMRDYMRGHLGRMSSKNIRLTVYDQLNPSFAKYYTQTEARNLLDTQGFKEIHLHHRHGYSWTVIGTKPLED